MARQEFHRIVEIDGLRGWAALCVVAFHFLWETFGRLHPEFTAGYLKLLMDGPLAVCIFFVLSGLSLSLPFLMSGDELSWSRLVAKRYFRLAIPVALVALFTAGVMSAGWTYNVAAAPIVQREDWLQRFLAFTPSVEGALQYGFGGVFGFPPANYNEFAWSVGVELAGSILVLLYVRVIPFLRRPLIGTLLIAAVAFAFTPYFGLFFVGSAFGLLLRDGWFARARASVWWNIAAITAIAGTFVLEWWRQSVAPPPADTLVGYVAGLYRDHFFNITAPVLTFACFCSYPITWLLSRPISRYFGRVSFSLFLLQFTVLSSLLSALIVHYRDKLGVEGCLAIVFVSLLATFALAEVFTRLEHVALRLVDRVVRAVTGPDATSPPRLK